jgi:hypothetical protein
MSIEPARCLTVEAISSGGCHMIDAASLRGVVV